MRRNRRDARKGGGGERERDRERERERQRERQTDRQTVRQRGPNRKKGQLNNIILNERRTIQFVSKD